jgi:hydrogenase maturation protease
MACAIRLTDPKSKEIRKFIVTTLSNSDTPAPHTQKKTVVLGVGNLLLSDEGIGVHVVKKLMDMALPREVEVIDGAVSGLGLMNVVMGADRLIVIDAVKGGGPPSSIYRFGAEDFATYPYTHRMSLHEIGVLEVIHLSGLMGHTPKTTVIGVEPKSLEIGMELSPEIQAKIPKIIELILDEVKHSD